MRTRPDNGWRYCRLCRNEQDRESRRRRLADPENGRQIKDRIAANQRARRRDPARRESVLESDRKRHARHRDNRLDGMREYEAKRKADGRIYMKNWGVTQEVARYAIEHKPDACECCGRTGIELRFDHDHGETKWFRGWLCHQCNVGIGLLGDTLEGVRNAAAYLERYHARTSQKI